MDCKDFQDELPDLVLTPGARPSVAAVAHMKTCPPCAEEYLSFQNTFDLLDTWTVPAPSPYFDQKLAVMIREEQSAPKMGWFERLQTRLVLNTGRNFKPAMAGALGLALLVGIGGGGYAGLSSSTHTPQPTEASATVNDLQILGNSEQAFQEMDELQQEGDDGAASPADTTPPAPPAS